MAEIYKPHDIASQVQDMRGFRPVNIEDSFQLRDESMAAVRRHTERFGLSPQSASWAPKAIPIFRDQTSGIFMASSGVYGLMSVNPDAPSGVQYVADGQEGRFIPTAEIATPQEAEALFQELSLIGISREMAQPLLNLGQGVCMTLFDTLPLRAQFATAPTISAAIAKLMDIHEGSSQWSDRLTGARDIAHEALSMGGISAVKRDGDILLSAHKSRNEDIVKFFRNTGIDVHIVSLGKKEAQEIIREDAWPDSRGSFSDLVRQFDSVESNILAEIGKITAHMRKDIDNERKQKGGSAPFAVEELHRRMNQSIGILPGLEAWFPLSYSVAEVVVFAQRIHRSNIATYMDSILNAPFLKRNDLVARHWQSIDVYPTGIVGAKLTG